MRALRVLGLLAVLAACGEPAEVGDDAGLDAGHTVDASADGGIEDAGLDGGLADDATVGDAGLDAAGDGDAAGDDAMVADAANLDAASLDAASLDAAGLDAANLDAAGADASLDGSSACGTVVATEPAIASPHVTECSVVAYASNPPTSGPHYPRWAAYQRYDAPVPAGFRVHALEHGAVAITYRCDTPCDAELAALAAHLAARPPDPRCATTSTPHQIVIAPDPALDVRFAVAAWGVSLRSECFDLPALDTFLDAHTGHAPEDTCAPGIDVHDPRWGVPAGCGS